MIYYFIPWTVNCQFNCNYQDLFLFISYYRKLISEYSHLLRSTATVEIFPKQAPNYVYGSLALNRKF